MTKLSLRTVTQFITALVALTALLCAIIGMLDYLSHVTGRRKPYTEFPPEYDDYADWGVE